MTDPILNIDSVSVSYDGAVRALQDVSVTVNRNSIVAVLGSNGAGKTTLLRAISRSLGSVGGKVTAGKIQFDGRDLATMDTSAVVRAGLVQAPEGRRIFRDLTVEENLQAGGYTVRNARERQTAFDRVFSLFPVLAERRNERGGLLSGGQQQMLAIGRALMTSPTLLLLDEPSLGLAPQMVEQVGAVVTEINSQGTSILLIEQYAAMGLRVADYAYVLETGRVVLEGSARELAQTDEVRDRYLAVEVTQPTPATAPTAPRKLKLKSTRAKKLSVTDLRVRFGGVDALAGANLTIEPGEVHALIGPNGAGKSTFINVLSGAYRATSGRVQYGDDAITSRPPQEIARLGVARTFQNISLTLDDSVEDNLLVGRHRVMKGGVLSHALRLPFVTRDEQSHRESVRTIAELLSIDGLLQRPVHTLSYGDRKKVELGRALAAEPGLLLLDEPVAGMNHGESVEMAETIRTVHEQLGLSILLVEHDMPFVMGLAEQITVLDFGKHIAEGTPEAIQKAPEVLRAYLGTAAS